MQSIKFLIFLIGSVVTTLMFLFISNTAGFVSLGFTCFAIFAWLVVSGGVSYQSHDVKYIDSVSELGMHGAKFLFGIGRYAK
tara:strand:- start:59 stop:304 length:246 start_codon:yes stop_codon:yes gene_type:complete